MLVRVRPIRTERPAAEIFAMGAACFAKMEVASFAVHMISRVAQLVSRDADGTPEITRLLGLLWVR